MMGLNIKNLLVASAISLASISSALAQVSYYDFSYSGDGGGFGGTINVAGTFTVDNSTHIITGITGGTVSGSQYGNGSISSVLSSGAFYGNNNVLTSATVPGYVSSGGVAFSMTGGGTPYYWNLYSDGGVNHLVGSKSLGAISNGQSSAGTMSVTSSGGAPEIDGALAPKVGFLLGCLYLLFGRKKQQGALLKTA